MSIFTYTVKPNLPEALKPLEVIAKNLWLSWNYDAIQLFMRLDNDVWFQSQQNPAKMLGMVTQECLDKAAGDSSFLAAMEKVSERLSKYEEVMKRKKTWYKGSGENKVAYFSMEYGMDVSLPVYSGGLGILSGDHMKTSSDLGLPLVGVGLLYQEGYFTQQLNGAGLQQEEYPTNDWSNLPVELKKDNGSPIKISVDLAGRETFAQIWEAKVGRSFLYLLDTNVEENAPDLRKITAALYGGDKETRIQQEILLGIGGIRALRKLGINLVVTHMNEGHSAFLGLERVREIMEERGFSFDEAREAVWPTNIFTTHTPVPAGNERFEIALMEKYFRNWSQQKLGLSWNDFLALGRVNPHDDRETFCLTVLALKLAAYANGVAKLHGKVSRIMWKDLWPGLPLREVPIKHVTNGVHPRTWIFSDMIDLVDRYFGPEFEENPANLDIWDRMERISDEELWRTHERRRDRLIILARDRIEKRLVRIGMTERREHQAEDALSSDALTICFARRFATYKRGNLLLRKPERLLKLLRDKERPIQLIFAGKAHPHDIPGKEIIKEIIQFAEKNEVTHRIVFIENYDMTVAKYMTSGGDVWLNTPRRPLEASGTSGMKAAMNGVLNCSILDGWWDEAFTPEAGWAIGHGEQYANTEEQDEIESDALYDLLEKDIIPLFYQRSQNSNLPREWVKRMKASMQQMGKSMSSHRMLMDYYNGFYEPAIKNYKGMAKGDYAGAKSLAAYLAKLQQAWKDIEIVSVNSEVKPMVQLGTSLAITASVKLGALSPEEIMVELYRGPVSSEGTLIEENDPQAISPLHSEMKLKSSGGNLYQYEATIECTETGMQGYTVRLLPRHAALIHPYRPGLVKWA